MAVVTDAPTIRASLAIEHDSIRPKAAWALETLASRRGWRLVVSDDDHARRPAAYGVEIGVGCEGSWLSIPFDAAQWQFTRAEPDATRDPLACAFWWLARVEEQLAHQSGDTGAFDEHGRFCSVAAAVAPGVSVLPVDDLAHSLLGELEMVCDRVAILVRGRVVRQGTVSELTRDSCRYEVTVQGRPPDWVAADRLLAAAGETVRFTVPGDDPAVLQPVIDRLRSEGRTIVAVAPVRESLEDLFMRAVGADGDMPTGGGPGGAGR